MKTDARTNSTPSYECPYCGEEMIFTGMDDGGGDYGDSICEIWECPDCDFADELNCVGDSDDWS